jgi:ribosome recycling factor
MSYDFGMFNRSINETLDWLKGEYAGIRTGRATSGILDTIAVNAYGSKMAINQLATITIDGPKSLRVIPWDKTISKSIDSAIRESNLGLSVSLDDEGLRISFPELSTERRSQLEKIAKEKLEDARIRIRSEREKVLRDLEKREKEETLSKDERFRLKNELQKLVDEVNSKLDTLAEKKSMEVKNN